MTVSGFYSFVSCRSDRFFMSATILPPVARTSGVTVFYSCGKAVTACRCEQDGTTGLWPEDRRDYLESFNALAGPAPVA
jgi:hypothetical protein